MENVQIREKKVNIQRINFDGNIESIPFNKMYISVNKVDDKTSKSESIQASKDYFYLENIDDDTYIFGELSFDPTDCRENFDAEVKYGILKLRRDENNLVIPNEEEIIVQAIYDRIFKNNDKTVIVNYDGFNAYFDYEKGVQLTPVVLNQAAPFNVDYEGFAECSTEYKNGYLPRGAKPVTNKEDIKLLSEEQVQELFKCLFEVDLSAFDNISYEEASSYLKRKK